MQSKRLNRREVLELAGKGLASAFVLSALDSKTHLPVKAANAERRFLLYIHCGSWDGIASGLLQPRSPTSWPQGCFQPGVVSEPTNPLLGQLTKVGPHIFHRYNRVLERSKEHLFHATVAVQSLDHNVAVNYALSGAAAGNPGWPEGFGQKMRRAADPVALILGSTSMTSTTVPNVTFSSSGSLAAFRGKFTEPGSVPTGLPPAAKNGFVNATVEAYRQHFGGRAIPVQFESTYMSSAKSWVQGFPDLAESSPTVSGLRSALSLQSTNEIFTEYLTDANDANEVRNRYGGYQSLREQLILAGALAKSGLAYGMQIVLDNEDYHRGSSEILTARSGAQLWAQLSLFWNWIKLQGLQNDVMVVVSHEFSRTPYNNQSQPVSATIGGVTKVYQVPGKDHGLCAGVWVLNGKLTPNRFGGIADGYLAGGATDLGGALVSGRPAPTLNQVMGSLMMKCFPNEFVRATQPSSGRLVKEIWPNFDETKDVIGAIKE
jgi:Protein of unknown function (DUF1501)